MPSKEILPITPPNSEAQKKFLTAKTKYVAYGGARGGGKTHIAREKAKLLAFNYAGIKMLILRRTFPQLDKNFIQEMRPSLLNFAKYNDSKKAFYFPNSSRIDFGYCANEKDVDQYQGQEYDIIFMDEATAFTETQFEKLDACVRGANDFPKRFYLTCNPGGVGHAWVKRLFIDRKYKAGENPDKYTFIPAKVWDNVTLMEKDPEYINTLKKYPENLRLALLEGDWDVFIGQYFSEWRRELHVIEPFVIPVHWRRYYAMDYGLDMLAGYNIAVDEDGFAVVYKELYEGKDNGFGYNGGGLLMSEAAQRVRDMTVGENIETFFAPPDMWNRRQDTGRSVAEAFAQHGVPLAKVDNSRVQGWLDLREWLKPQINAEGIEIARLRVFDNCTNLIESMPALIYDEKNPNDCAKEPHEFTHAPDALRYFIAGRPYAAKGVAQQEFNEETTYEEQTDSFLDYGI